MGFAILSMMERKLKRATDLRHIDLNDAYAMEFWAKELSVPMKKLNAAVLAVGPIAADVKRELKKVNP